MLKRLLSLFRYAWLTPILLYRQRRQPRNWGIALAINDLYLEAFDPNWEENFHKASIKKLVEKTDPKAVEAWKKLYP